MAFKVKKGHENIVYMGLDPLTQLGNIRLPLSQMSDEQIQAWGKLNPQTSLVHLDLIIETQQAKKPTIADK